MPVSPSVRRRCQDLLEPGERIAYLIPVSAVWLGTAASGVDCFVVVSDRRIAVLIGGLLRRDRPKEVNLQYPRTTRLGPVERDSVPQFQLGGRVYEIEDEYVAQVNAADAELDGAGAFPRDPFPDL
ncbi:hypothetical protein [Jiangella asiatica]|uniref:Uncharacterized protein n=1 Tax=Jiangella asiatica TaxID=2530372 RepID=A0A4R5DE65_9ACTN|nr:hypothetical protein [Jiangella asiatica]TDE08875.1 hypothetical protein E1269_15695 [Jiangella asiatica]